MIDYVSREAVLEILHSKGAPWDAYAKVQSIPAADVRPVVRGRWTLNKDGSGVCSECGFIQSNCWDLDGWDNFCHHCGADMREVDNEKA